MRAVSELSSYEEVEFSITITAKVKDWRRMLDVLCKLNPIGWPLVVLRETLEKSLQRLDKTHSVSVEDKEP